MTRHDDVVSMQQMLGYAREIVEALEQHFTEGQLASSVWPRLMGDNVDTESLH